MRLLSRTVSAAIAAAAVMSIAPSAIGQDKKPVELRYTTGAPAKTPWVMQLERFEKDVDEETKGALKIQAFHSAQLGNEQDTVQQVARGRIDMGGFSSGSVALIVPELGLLALPFYFASIAEQDCVIDEHLTKPVAAMLAKKGIQFLGWTEVGTVDVVGKKPYLTPAEVKGLKAAAASHRVSSGMWAALGANPTVIGITEISSAFQTGLVDVNATVVTFYLPSGLAKAAPVMTRLEMSDAPGIILMNKANYDRLSAEQRAALDKAVARRPAAQLRAEIRGFEETLRGMHVKAGGTIVQATPEQREAWRKLLQPVWPAMVKDVGGEAAKIFELMETGKKACGNRKA